MSVITLGILELPGDLLFEGDRNFCPVGMAEAISCRGVPLRQYGSVVGNRPITLTSPDRQTGWFTTDQIDQLVALAETEAAEFTLTLPGTTEFTVIFDHSKQPPFQFKQLYYQMIPPAGHYWSGTLYLKEA